MLKCAVKGTSYLVTVVGTIPETHVGSVLALEGSWRAYAKYGCQLFVEKFEERRSQKQVPVKAMVDSL